MGSEDEQIAWITQAESYTPFAFSMSISQEDVDHILHMEGNADHSRMMIATEFSKGKSDEEIAEFLKSTFHNGNGIVINNGRYSVWYAEDGIHIATDRLAEDLKDAAFRRTLKDEFAAFSDTRERHKKILQFNIK